MPQQGGTPTVGVVGLGNLGEAMALHLIEEGWRVLAVDRSADRLAALADAGAEETAPSGLADCDVIAFVVPDERAIHAVLDDGLADALGSGNVVVVHSTVVPERARELEEAVTGTGARFVDAPVTGGADRARQGELTAFVGAEQAGLDAVRTYLDTVASDVHHLGVVGAGAAVKLANQLVMFAALAGVFDAVRLAAAYDVDESRVLDAISTGTADTWVGRNWGFFDRVTRAYDDAGVAAEDRPWRKDIREVVEAASSVGTPTALAALLSDTIAETLEAHAVEARDDEEQAR